MKKTTTTLNVLAACLMVGCATGPEAQTGTVFGGILGAATGGIIGHQSGRGLEGAALGAGIGALGGNMLGNAQDQRNYYAYQRQSMYRPSAPAPVVYVQPQYQRPANNHHYHRNYYICH